MVLLLVASNVEMCCTEATVFSPDNVSAVQNEVDSDSARDSRPLPVERFYVSNLDSSVDDSMDQTEAQ